MSWVNALALAGAAFVALPILIHLMGRAPARTERFPSLRFISPARLLPSRRTKIQDPLLLLLRALTLLLAALALAGPVFDAAHPTSAGSQRAVVAILDLSESVTRAGALNAARTSAENAVAGASAAAIVGSTAPGEAIPGALTWLGEQTGERELVIVSDFQVGALTAPEIAVLPADVKFTLRRVAASPGSLEARAEQRGVVTRAQISFAGEATRVSWFRAAPATALPFEVIAGPGESGDIDLARRAASVVARAAPTGAAHEVALVYPNAPARAQLTGAKGRKLQPWQAEILARLAADPLMEGAPGVEASTDRDGKRLLILVSMPVASDLSVTTQAALARAIAGPLNAAELEPRFLRDAELPDLQATPRTGTMTRAAGQRPAESGATRWLWLAALAMLTLEWLVRRSSVKVAEAVSAA